MMRKLKRAKMTQMRMYVIQSAIDNDDHIHFIPYVMDKDGRITA
jgi:hypothetical protein